MGRVKSFFMKLIPTKRRLIQLYAALLFNANIKGFIDGRIYTGDEKSLCIPGFNCYSCPGAIGACPLGSLQNALSESKTKWPTYVIGIILLYCIIFGRTICGFFCPGGLLQELLYKIKTPKLRKNKVTRILSYFKYVLLAVLVIAIPIIYSMSGHEPVPTFCQYICPIGTFEGGIFLLSHPNNADYLAYLGPLFTWKFALLMGFIVASIFIYRFFCRFFCPLGAIYGFFNKLSIIGIKVDKSKCNSCGACVSNCKMDVKEVGDHECINCGECRNVCHCNAISWKTISKLIKDDQDANNEIQTLESNESMEGALVETTNDDVKEEVTNELSISPKKKKISRGKLVSIISWSVALVFLVFVLVYINFFTGDNTLSIGDSVSSLNINLFDDEKYDIKEDENSTILYFYNEYNENDIISLDALFDELPSDYTNKLNIIAIGDEDNKDTYQTLLPTDTKIIFGYASDSVIKTFLSDAIYPYFVYLDASDTIVMKQETIISNDELNGIIIPSLMGKSIGKNVGDICINQEIGLIGSEDTFSVLQNRGRITVINFWFTTCNPCLDELPHFDSVYKEFSDYIDVIAIDEASEYARNPQKVEDFVAEKFASYSIMFGHDNVNSNYFNALGGKDTFPMTVIVDQDGVITYNSTAALTEAALRAEIVKLLEEN